MTQFQVPYFNLGRSKVLDSDGLPTKEWAFFLKGLQGPTVATFALAKLTPAGANGSISVNAYGFITEIVEPT